MPTSADLDLPPYDPQRILTSSFPERGRLVCLSGAAQFHSTPIAGGASSSVAAASAPPLAVGMGSWR